MAQILVKDAMHPGVVSCTATTAVADAAKLMNRSNLRSLVVVDDECGLVGIVSQSDLVNATLLHGEASALGKPLSDDLTVGDIMTRHVVTITPEARLEDAAREMIQRRIHRIVVAAPGNPCNPIGILSMGDIMRHMMQE